MPSFLKDILTSEQEIIDYTEYFYSDVGKALRELFIKYLDKEAKFSSDKSDSELCFNKPEWSGFQANHIGFRNAIRKFKIILDR